MKTSKKTTVVSNGNQAPYGLKEDAKTEYETAKSDIANLLGFFECELGKTPQEIDWTHVGSLKHVRQNLMETLSFMSGIQVQDIEDTLEETRL
jgi:hypothetical protein